jgi:CheY-like chemotaxis protein
MSAATRILVVDDNDLMRSLVAEMLEMQGYGVEQAESGPAALQQIEANPPQLVVLDLWMPGMNGWELLERLKSHPSPPPVLVMSGVELHEPQALRASSRCVCGYLAKPFTSEQLLKACALGLKRRASPESAEPPEHERRREPRRILFLSATLLSEDGLPVAKGEIVSLSRAGAGLELGAVLKPGTPLVLSLDIPGGQGAFQVSATVKSHQAAVLGLEFAELSAEDRRRLGDLVSPEE